MPDGVDHAVRSRLLEAVTGHTAVEIEYVSAEDRRTTRVIEPRGLYTDGAAWYVEAWCHHAREERTFRLDRILGIRPATAPATADRPPAERETGPTDVVLLLDRRRAGSPRRFPGRTCGRWATRSRCASR